MKIIKSNSFPSLTWHAINLLVWKKILSHTLFKIITVSRPNTLLGIFFTKRWGKDSPPHLSSILHYSIKRSKLYDFADDTNLLNLWHSMKNRNKQVIYDLKNLSNSINAKKTCLNVSKTEAAIFKCLKKANIIWVAPWSKSEATLHNGFSEIFRNKSW